MHKRPHAIKVKEALWQSAFWISLAVLFGIGVFFVKGQQSALEFFAAYLIEESLSVDNLFVFILIFQYFRVPDQYQHKILFWGILGALVMRAFFITAGLFLINKFHFIIYIFGAFLLYTGLKMAFEKEKEMHPEKNPVLKLVTKMFPVAPNAENGRFILKIDGKTFITPLFVALICVELTDLVFAMDSIPAVLAISKDSFIVYTSNIFAILGLRSLYFALAGVIKMFEYLKFGLSAVLAFIGVKMLISHYYHIPIGISLGVVAGLIGVSILVSILHKKPGEPHDPRPGSF